MPSSHLNFLCHINFGWFLLVGRIRWILRDYFLTLVCSVCSSILSTFVHELYIDAAVSLVLDVDNMYIGVVSTSNHHA